MESYTRGRRTMGATELVDLREGEKGARREIAYLRKKGDKVTGFWSCREGRDHKTL